MHSVVSAAHTERMEISGEGTFVLRLDARMAEFAPVPTAPRSTLAAASPATDNAATLESSVADSQTSMDIDSGGAAQAFIPPNVPASDSLTIEL